MNITFAKYPNLFVFFAFCMFITVNSSLLTVNCYGQSITWQRLYRPSVNGSEIGYGLCQADSSNFYAAGFTAHPLRKAYILKINKYGDTLWTRIFDQGEIYSVAPTNDNGCIITGYFGSAFACRMRPNGDTVWLKNYNANLINDIKKTTDGNYILCGSNTTGSIFNGYVCKIDTSGILLWEKIYTAIFAIDFFKIELALAGGYIIAGEKYDSGSGLRYGYIANINDSGIIQWERLYSLTSGITKVLGIEIKNQGYVFTGATSNFVFVMKTNILGDSLLTRLYQTSNNMDLYTVSLLKQNENKYYVTYSSGLNSTVFSTDSNFAIINQRVIAPQNSLILSSMLKAPNSISNDILCIGASDALSFGDQDLYIVRLDSSLSAPPPIGIRNLSNIMPENYFLFQNYPNPFNPITIIQYTTTKVANIKLIVYDVNGRLIKELKESNKNIGVHKILFDGTSLSSGIYFYQLIVDDKIMNSKKMCLIK